MAEFFPPAITSYRGFSIPDKYLGAIAPPDKRLFCGRHALKVGASRSEQRALQQILVIEPGDFAELSAGAFRQGQNILGR